MAKRELIFKEDGQGESAAAATRPRVSDGPQAPVTYNFAGVPFPSRTSLTR